VDKTEVLTIIDSFRKRLEFSGIQVEKIILFGSYAHGTDHSGSDIDLVVISNGFEQLDFWQRIELIADAIFQVMKPIEAVPMTLKEWESGDSFISSYAANGETVYAA